MRALGAVATLICTERDQRWLREALERILSVSSG
jgi:hypothetical protein